MGRTSAAGSQRIHRLEAARLFGFERAGAQNLLYFPLDRRRHRCSSLAGITSPWSGQRMLKVMGILALLLTCVDHWTTYLCLRSPVDGWQISEANPMADWLFGVTGLLPGLAIDTFITLIAVTFLVTTMVVSHPIKMIFLATLTASTGYAVINNMLAIQTMGLWPLAQG
jgi:hypothetical protein